MHFLPGKAIYNVIKEKHGDIGVEHWRGRHPYTLSEAGGDEGVYKNPYVATVDKSQPLRAPSPVGGERSEGEGVDSQKVAFIAHRSLMEDMFQTDPGGVVKMTAESLEFFKGEAVQEKLYEKRESFVQPYRGQRTERSPSRRASSTRSPI